MKESLSLPLIDQYWHTGGVYGLVARTGLRVLQFVFAVIVAALYGVDLAHASKTHASAPSQWIYAQVPAALSALTCIIHCFVAVKRVAWSTWDAVLAVLWMAQTGVFGSLYLSGSDPVAAAQTQNPLRMRVAVWIDLVNLVLWLMTTVLGIGWCIRARKITRRTDKLESDGAGELEKNKDAESLREGEKTSLEEAKLVERSDKC